MKLAASRMLVTGAASGVGLACFRKFTELGADVWGVDSSEESLVGARELASPGSADKLLHADVSDPDQVASVAETIFESAGGLDVVLNNAAVLRDQTLCSRLGKRVIRHSLSDWSDTLAANLTGTFLVAREIAGRWLEGRASGLIINTSSVVRVGNPGQSAYAASKAAVESLTVTWSRELAPYKIRVAAIAYGFAETGMTRNIPALFLDKIRQSTPVGRFAAVDELVDGVRFICENDYFAGRVLDLDGGLRF